MNYEYDNESKQYRRRKDEGGRSPDSSKHQSGNIYQTASSAENRRPKSYHKPWTHSRKKWKALFWVIFSIGLVLWLAFMVYLFKNGAGTPSNERPINPMEPKIPNLPQ